MFQLFCFFFFFRFSSNLLGASEANNKLEDEINFITIWTHHEEWIGRKCASELRTNSSTLSVFWSSLNRR